MMIWSNSKATIRRFLWLLTALALLLSGTIVHADSGSDGGNLAYGKPASANSNSEGAAYVTDGDLNTAWAATYHDVAQYVTVDLGDFYYLDRIEVASRRDIDEEDSRSDWTVDVSRGVYFFEPHEVGRKTAAGPFGSDLLLELDGTEAWRYIRVKASLYLAVSEIRAYGTRAENVARGKTAFASSSAENANLAVDGDEDIFWAQTGEDGGQFVGVDLGGSYRIDRIKAVSRRDIDQEKSRAGWRLQLSNDISFEEFTEAAYKPDPGSFGSDLEVTVQTEEPFRYVRVVSDQYLVLAELEVFGERTASSTNVIQGRPYQSVGCTFWENPPELLVDGNASPGVSTHLMYVSTSPGGYIRYDLGNYYSVSELLLIARSDLAEFPAEETADVEILGSAEKVDVDEMTVLAKTPSEGAGELTSGAVWRQRLETPEKYRYIAIRRKTGGFICFAELQVTTPDSVVFGNWNVCDNGGNDVSVLMPGAQLRLSIPVTSLEEDAQYLFCAAGYDGDGALTTLAVDRVSAAAGETALAEADLVTTPETKRIAAALLTATEEARPLSVPVQRVAEGYRLEPVAGTPGETGLRQTEEGMILTIDATGRPSDRLVILALDPNGSVAYFNALDDMESGRQYRFAYHPEDPFGKYTVIVATAGYGGELQRDAYGFWKLTEEQKSQCLSSFRLTGAAGFAAVLAQYGDLAGLSVLAPEEKLAALGESFVLAREGYEKGLLRSGYALESIASLQETVETALLIETMKTGTAAEICAAATRFGAPLSKLFDEDISYQKFASLYKYTPGSIETLCHDIRYYAALSYIKDGTYAQILTALERYAQILSVDLDYLRGKNVSLAEVAKRIDHSLPDSYIINLPGEIRRITDEIAAERKKPSGGSGGGGGVKLTAPGLEPVLPNPAAPVLPEKKLRFADVDDVPWAEDAIDRLCDMKILEGVGEGRFEPHRPVQREEFTKILVGAFPMEPEGEAEAFTDCLPESWFYPYVAAASAGGMMQGVGDGLFGAGRAMTRQDLAVACAKLPVIKDIPVLGEGPEFTDGNRVAPYAAGAVRKLAAAGILTGGDDGAFRPEDSVTRAETAVVISRLLTLEEGEK